MTDTATKRRPGRPPIGDKPMVRVEIMMPPDLLEEARTTARMLDVSLSEVLRAWIEAGGATAREYLADKR